MGNGIPLPQERGNDGKWYPIVFPKSAETRVALTEALFSDRMIAAVATTVWFIVATNSVTVRPATTRSFWR